MARVANDLHEFVDMLRAAGELHEVMAEVSSDLEITEITDRTTKQGGPALLFSNVRGASMPVLTNQFGSDRRLEMAFGVAKIDDIAGRIEGL
ncbi:MAG: UbiD family decarboxylase, partial [Thermoleophilia bacterium]|nr:UbiD family decarboxylase [Thermoleophilia bacterium]